MFDVVWSLHFVWRVCVLCKCVYVVRGHFGLRQRAGSSGVCWASCALTLVWNMFWRVRVCVGCGDLGCEFKHMLMLFVLGIVGSR